MKLEYMQEAIKAKYPLDLIDNNAKEHYEFDNAKSTKDYLNSYTHYSYSNEVSDEQRTARLYRK